MNVTRGKSLAQQVSFVFEPGRAGRFGVDMNLKDHKVMLRDYESVLLELQELLRAKEQRISGWSLQCPGADCALQVPDEFVAKVLQERIWELESDAKDRARVLGLEA